ncbi:unnamed protein product, partial [Brenthis ino]
MRFLIICALVAVAIANPVQIQPDNGVVVVGNEDSYEPISVDPVIIDEGLIQPPMPIVQIIIKVNSKSQIVDVAIPTPVIVADQEEANPDSVILPQPVLPVPVPEPGIIGEPVLPPQIIPVVPAPDIEY